MTLNLGVPLDNDQKVQYTLSVKGRTKLSVAIGCAFLCLLTSCRGLHSSMDVRVCFYGKVVDQDGNPLSKVKISASVRHWLQPDIMAFAAGARFVRISTETDKTGRFKLKGASGDALTIERVEKEQYQWNPEQREFHVVEGTANLPVVFKMHPTEIH